MIDPVNEGLAYGRNIRLGIQSMPDVLRERGYDPEAVMAEIKSSNDQIDKLKLILDSDPRNTTQAGQLQGGWHELLSGLDPADPGKPIAPPTVLPKKPAK